MFENLEVLIVKPGGPPQKFKCGTPLVTYRYYLEALSQVHEKATRPWALLPARSRPLPLRAYGDAARQAWREWLEGHCGCWDVDEVYFKACKADV